MEYKVGMKAKYINNDISKAYGKICTIVYVDKYDVDLPYGIEFKENMDTSIDCRGYGRYGYCWWANKKDIIICNPKERIK